MHSDYKRKRKPYKYGYFIHARACKHFKGEWICISFVNYLSMYRSKYCNESCIDYNKCNKSLDNLTRCYDEYQKEKFGIIEE